MKYLFYRLIIYLDTANEHDTNYNIAWFMANNFKRVAKMGISEIAKACFVSPATISRFCRAIGYENFAHLKQECTMYRSNSSRSTNLANVSEKDILKQPAKATSEYTKLVAKTITDMNQYLDWYEIDACLRLIHDGKNVAFFGTQFSHSAALHLQTDLMMMDKFVVAHMDVERQIECARELTKEDVAVIISVNGNYEHSCPKAINAIKKSGAKSVLITSNPTIDLCRKVDHVILIGDKEHMKMGKHTLLTVVELMACRYFALYSHENRA